VLKAAVLRSWVEGAKSKDELLACNHTIAC
jgi:hypothetical protein